MAVLPRTKNAVARLEHIRSYVNSAQYSKSVMEENAEEIERQNGDMLSRAWFLDTYLLAHAMFAWFVDDNIMRTKSLFYNQAKIRYICTTEDWDDTRDKRTFKLFRVLEALPALVSDNEGLIKWYSNADCVLRSEGIDDHQTYDYQLENFFIAMRGEWDLLEYRCRNYISNPSSKTHEPWSMSEFEYYLGLSIGDVEQMEKAINDLTTPKCLRSRADYERGYTNGIISSQAVVYSKLAWRNGYEVNINSPYVPKEWLPVQPLERYEDEFDFMKAYTIDPTWGGKFA